MSEQVKKISIYNKGIRAFKLPGGVVIFPSSSVEVDAEYATKNLAGYPDLVDAATINPATKKKITDLEAQNAELRARIAKLEGGDAKPEVPAAAPAPVLEAPAPASPAKPRGR